MKIIILQYGARRHYAVPTIFYQKGILSHFYTDIYSNQGILKYVKNLLSNNKNPRIQKLLSRAPKNIPSNFITGFNSFGIYINQKWAITKTPTEFTNVYLKMGKGLSKRVIQKGLFDADLVYGFNGECMELLKFAKENGFKTVLDQTIIPKEAEMEILDQEYDNYPEWEIKPEKNLLLNEFIDRQHSEWSLADMIICGSEFVKKNLIHFGCDGNKIEVVPSGFDSIDISIKKAKIENKLNILFIGEIGLRKGIPYLYEAAKYFKNKMNFRIIGASKLKAKKIEELKNFFEIFPSIPRNEIYKHYNWADVFVFPTICEGSAMVTYEALRHNLPVITTENAGSIVRNYKDGFIVPAKNSDAIIDKLNILDKDRELLYFMSKNAYERSLDYTIDKYSNRLINSLEKLYR